MEKPTTEQSEILFSENFQGEFSIGTNDAKWFYFSSGAFIANDGVAITSPDGLAVNAKGKNPITGKPEFTISYGHESQTGGIPGGLDHAKWLVYTNHPSTKGIPGFDVVAGTELLFETDISVQTFGTENHPFGSKVTDPDTDLRLAYAGMNLTDLETMVVFDFVLTNKRIYAFYERLPFGRVALGNYAAYSYAIPVADRLPQQRHRLQISHNADTGTVSWFVDGKKVYSTAKIGFHIERKYMVLNHGGEETLVKPTQLVCGMGLFTLLDAHYPGLISLEKLSEVAGFYFDPEAQDDKTPETFFDNESDAARRLFGQGASLQLKQYTVTRKFLKESNS